MSLRGIAVMFAFLVTLVVYLAWSRNAQHAPEASGPVAEMPAPDSAGAAAPPDAANESAPPMVPKGSDPGIAWQVPSRWKDRGPGSVRLATYTIPGRGGADDAQCAVYYFGPGQGGGIDPNLERWRGEFKGEAHERRDGFDTRGGKVTRLSLSGTYLAHAGMMGGGEGDPVESTHWALLGAIVQGPQGDVFFKLTGPAATVQTAGAEFEAMLRSTAPR